MSGSVIFHSVLNFIFLLKSKKREKKSVCVLTVMKPRSELPPIYLKKFDFGFFMKKQKTIK